MKVGILFGGPSREREISFAGGRTVYDNLNKSLFTPIPVFIDSLKQFILLDWEYVYKGTIRDFYPPIESHPKSDHDFQIYIESLANLTSEELNKIADSVGKRIEPTDFHKYFDVAFLALHGQYGEDGLIQGILDNISMPYTGSGIRSSALGMDKSIQKKMMSAAGFHVPKMVSIKRRNWEKENQLVFYRQVKEEIGFPLVVRPANQGSSIGVSILMKDEGERTFVQKIDAAFFKRTIIASEWNSLDAQERREEVRDMADIRSGLGFPLFANGEKIYHPESLWKFLDSQCIDGKDVLMESVQSECTVVVESFIHGKEFSCIVLRQEDGRVTALPPTEIVKQTNLYDYKSKYLPGRSRKITPIELPDKQINAILEETEKLFDFLDFQTYARIDGFYGDDGLIYLNDPNTTSGMLPSSFFFHQAAEIGLNPSQFLTFILRNSLQERLDNALYLGQTQHLLNQLDSNIDALRTESSTKVKVAVIFGGYSFERHISVESGRNIYEKLSSSDKYEPIPVFLYGDETIYELIQVPIPLLLKDNADDIKEKISEYKKHTVVEQIQERCTDITNKYVSQDSTSIPIVLSLETLAEKVDVAFIALHGRPGEDGSLQEELKRVNLPYNGSDWESSHITIDKFATLQKLKKHGFSVADQHILERKEEDIAINELEQQYEYPFILKPIDDGCSSAVKMIKNRDYLAAYLEGIFRSEDDKSSNWREKLSLAQNEEFPSKPRVLAESLISREDSSHFLEVTGGLLTHIDESGNIQYEMFEPSEALASGEILSLEEKFLAGEGQNITPARFAARKEDYEIIASRVKNDLERAARILKVKGYARIDAFVRIFKDNQVETIIIEVNSLPGMTPATCIFHQCAINGYKPYEFIDQIIQFAMNEQEATKY